jgi:hypothetical protein
MIQRLAKKLVALAALTLLGGCFVISDSKPIQVGPINDEAIVGDWRSVDESTGKLLNAFMHIQKIDDQEPLRVIFVEGNDHNVYTLTTSRAGKRKVFAAAPTGPDAKAEYLLGYYEVEADALKFHFLDSEKAGKLIAAGKLAGVPGEKAYDSARLTGPSAEITKFLASDDGWNARISDASRLRRMRPEE